MAEHRSREEWNALIDGALRSYAGTDPVLGLPERVLGRVNTAVQISNAAWWRRWPAFAVTGGAAAVAFAVMLVWHPLKVPPRETPAQVVAVAVPPEPLHRAGTAPTAARKNAAAGRIIHRRSTPRPDVFPAPTRLSPEEQAILAVAQNQHIGQALVISQQERAGDIQPLEVSAIQIQPLPADSEQKEN